MNPGAESDKVGNTDGEKVMFGDAYKTRVARQRAINKLFDYEFTQEGLHALNLEIKVG